MNIRELEEISKIYGFQKASKNNYKLQSGSSDIDLIFYANGTVSARLNVEGSRRIKVYPECASQIENVLIDIDSNLSLAGIDIFHSTSICNTSDTARVIECAISSRDLSKDMVRVRSSNLWAYTINIRNRKDKVGDVLVTFKGKYGGKGDTYIYYNVPVVLWKRWVVAPSKGHFFWVHIRNNFKYSKLTGDKRGKLANAIN